MMRLHRDRRIGLIWLLLAGAIGLVPSMVRAEDAADPATFFELKIRPILASSCFKCHGTEKASSNLRVDSRAALMTGGESGPAIVPGNPDASALIRAIRYENEELRMPPNKRLPDTVVADFVAWVKQGAAWPESKPGVDPAFGAARHWSFEPVKRTDPPADPSGWAEQRIDRFIAAKLRSEGLTPLGPTSRTALVRRVYFDLWGLPPSPAEVAEFLADESPDALRRLVDRLLDSPRYGERWGRHWMDVARYADTAGDNADYPIPEIRLYRDYIIDAFNRDKPYDQFIREQIAGDLLARQHPDESYAEQVIATGFIALSRRYATAPYELMHLTLEDSIDTVGRAVLGLTLRCARCHDHKFDPVTNADYYALYGIFASTRYPYAGSEELSSKGFNRSSFMPLVPPDVAEPQLKPYELELSRLQADLQMTEQFGVEYLADFEADLTRMRSRIAELEARKEPVELEKEHYDYLIKRREEWKKQHQTDLSELRRTLRNRGGDGLPRGLAGAYAVSEGTPVHTAIHLRGEPADPGPLVKRGVPKFLAGDAAPQFPEDASGRLQLAQWLTSPQNPLTARVMVNRIWQQHFGRGIVTTPSNFGMRGEDPTHPELLDSLTATFIDSGWSIKAMHREILLSKTYQLASAEDAVNAEKDPGNKWYWRYDRRRLDAESIRDALLTVSGELKLDRPGPHPFPKIETWGWTQHAPFKEVYPTSHRSVYLMTQRIQRHPYLALFDGPDPNTTTDQRSSSIVPLQALFLLNNPWMLEEVNGFAQRLVDSSPDASSRIRLAHEVAYGRDPLPFEEDRGLTYLKRYSEELVRAGAETDKLELEAWRSYAHVLLSANEFVYLD